MIFIGAIVITPFTTIRGPPCSHPSFVVRGVSGYFSRNGVPPTANFATEDVRTCEILLGTDPCFQVQF